MLRVQDKPYPIDRIVAAAEEIEDAEMKAKGGLETGMIIAILYRHLEIEPGKKFGTGRGGARKKGVKLNG